MVAAEFYIGRLGKGCSCPHIILGNDGYEYVVKFKGNPQGTRILANEYICARLAAAVDLPVPPVVKIHVSSSFISAEPELAGWGFEGGMQFGSRLMKAAWDNPSRDIIAMCRNKAVIPGIIAFDHWVDNRDRANNSGNILAVRDGNAYRLVMIDHGLALGGTNERLSQLLSHSAAPIWGSVYEMFAQQIVSQIDFEPYIQRIEGLNRETFEEILNDTPQAWLPANQRNAVVDYLDQSRRMVRMCLEHLGQYLPGWA